MISQEDNKRPKLTNNVNKRTNKVMSITLKQL